MTQFINKTNLEFIDISSEEHREYIFDNITIRIEDPSQLNVSKNGHRIFTTDGISYYIPLGWRAIKWKAKIGQPNFVK